MKFYLQNENKSIIALNNVDYHNKKEINMALLQASKLTCKLCSKHFAFPSSDQWHNRQIE